MKLKLLEEVRFANNFLWRNTRHDINIIEGNVMKIVEWLPFESRAQWQTPYRLIHRHQHLLCCDLTAQQCLKTKNKYSDQHSCCRCSCGLLDDHVLSSKHTRNILTASADISEKIKSLHQATKIFRSNCGNLNNT